MSVVYQNAQTEMRVPNAHAQSQFWAVKIYCDTRVIHLDYARAALAWTEEKRSLRNEKLKANRAS